MTQGYSVSGRLPTPDGDETEQDIAQQDQDWEESRQFVYNNLKQTLVIQWFPFTFPYSVVYYF